MTWATDDRRLYWEQRRLDRIQADALQRMKEKRVTTHYTNSAGNPVEIATMLHSHLVNAHAKLLREEPEREDEIEAMAAQIAANETRFAAQRQELESEGVFVTEGVDPGNDSKAGFVACQANGDVIAFAKNEDGAWAKAWQSLRGDA